MIKKILKSYDYSLIVVFLLLSVFGLIMIYSASMVVAVQTYGVKSNYFFIRQCIFLGIGLIGFLFFALFPYKLMLKNKILIPLVLISIFALISVLFIGINRGNAQSWFAIGPFSLQPSEFTKLAVIIYLSAVYAKKRSYINEFNKGVIPPLIYLIIICVLIVMQPDYGTAGIIFLIAVTIIISSGMNLKNIMRLVGLGTAVIIPIVIVLHDKIFSANRLQRIQVLTDPFADGVAQKGGYHLVNSFLAIGGGGVKGLGLGQSIQKLGYLPHPHTDFIMAVIAEELGILGVLFVLFCIGFIVIKGLITALRSKDPFGSLLAIGISSMIGIQSFINLGGITGLIPLTGVPLPFVSYGGSSLIQLCIAMGILVNVSMFVNYEHKYKNNILNENKKGLSLKSNQ